MGRPDPAVVAATALIAYPQGPLLLRNRVEISGFLFAGFVPVANSTKKTSVVDGLE